MYHRILGDRAIGYRLLGAKTLAIELECKERLHWSVKFLYTLNFVEIVISR